MPLSTNFNVTPYYDDYDESKGYYRILFKPGYGIQARELTQLQTALQKQVERVGAHSFKNGSKVIGGDITLDTDVHSLQLEMQYLGENINAASFIGKTITGVTSNARARVVASQAPTSLLQPILMFHYLGGDTFVDGEIVKNEVVPPVESDTYATTISINGPSAMSNAVANGSVVSMSTGVYFLDGHFVLCPANTIILSTSSITPSGRIGLEISETIKTSDDDNSLLDPADGTFNYAAPGATRLDIALSLVKKEINVADPISQVADPNFIQLLKIVDGIKHENVEYPVYTAIEKTLTKKSHLKSGDFTSTPFDLKLSSHRGLSGTTANSGMDGTTVYGNNTRFTTELSIGDKIYLGSNTTTAEVSAIANNSRLTVTTTLSTGTSGLKIFNESEIQAGLSSGKALIDGYEYESVSTEYLDLDKGRGSAVDEGYSMGVEIGNYIVIDNPTKFFNVGTHEILHLHNVKSANINVESNTEYLATQTGTARIRGLKWDSSTGNTSAADTNHSNYRAYLYDIDTSNSVTGTVGGASANTRIIQLNTADTSYVNTTYVGSTITVNTTNGVDTTSDIRSIDEYVSNSTGHFATVNSVFSQATIANSTYEISFTIGDTQAITVAEYSLSLPGADAVINSYADIAATGKTSDSESGEDFNLLANQWLVDAAKEVVNSLPRELKMKCVKIDSLTSSTPMDLDGKGEVFHVTRENSNSGYHIGCREINPIYGGSADDETSLHYATATDPVCWIESDTGGDPKLFVKPNPTASQPARVHYLSYPPNSTTWDGSNLPGAATSISNFPDELEHLVVLRASITAAEYMLMTEEDPEIYLPMIQNLKQDLNQGLQAFGVGVQQSQQGGG